MNTSETLNKVRTLLGIEVKFEQQTLENGTVLEAEVFEVGAEIFIVSDDERVAVPVGEYSLQDGKMIVVVEEGVISEIKDAESEEEAPAEEEVAAEEVAEEELSTEVATPKKVVESVSKETFFSEIEKLRSEIAELKLSKVEETPSKEVELSAETEEVSGISHNPEKATQERQLNLHSQKAKMTTRQRIFNKLK